MVDGEGATVLKPKRNWTAKEKATARSNAHALSAIFNSLPVNLFTKVQGCTSVKEAWDILQVTFEGTSNVKRTRLDTLVSEFENLFMRNDESINDFSSKLSTMTQEAVVLGECYKDKKLVKKLDQVAGKMQTYELQMKKKDKVGKPSALYISEFLMDISEENMGLLVKKSYRKLGRELQKEFLTFAKVHAKKDNGKADKQCKECDGFGHFKVKCPNLKLRNKLRCVECKGLGHLRSDYFVKSKTNQKPYITWSESNTKEESDDTDVLNNLVAHIGIIEEDQGAESEEDDNNLSLEE